ncbi:hypothetical protein ACLOJK_000978 [Asimina triloba]
MDDFLDHILSSSSWADDANGAGQPSWVGSSSAEANGLLANPMGIYEGDGKNSSSLLNITMQGAVIGHMPNYGLNKGLFSEEAQLPNSDRLSSLPPHLDNGSCESQTLLQGVIDTSPKSQSSGLQLNTSVPISHSSSQLPVISCSAPPLWHPTYSGVSSLPPVMEQSKLQGFSPQGEFMKSSLGSLGSRFIADEKVPQLDNLPKSNVLSLELIFKPASCLRTSQYSLPPFPIFWKWPDNPIEQSFYWIAASSAGASPLPQQTNQPCFSQLPPGQPASGGSNNGTVKPRVRARRGQATDPHSIAERLRREKIAERMKNLQELVPNSNKTDKASMLDEIIEYVKFLQLQVKVLSMSRLGAAGAVVPLITDVQSEGSSGLILSASVGRGGDLSESPDNIAFEQEIVKLMESNVTTAMQYLQTKGLCLMPIALAAAISGEKSPSNATDRKNLSMAHIPSSQLPVSTNGSTTTEDAASHCNGAVNKHEEPQKSDSKLREI